MVETSSPRATPLVTRAPVRGSGIIVGVDESDLRRRVAEARVARLATIEADGRAHLVPICFAVEGGRLYSAVDGKPKRSRDLRRLRNLRERPWATVLVDHYEEDWSRLWWARLRGPARVLDSGADAERALALLAEKYPQYRREPPAGPVIAVDLAEWRAWSADGR
jgi:PPOX class probable F420-dependent enzyme